jgi:hypothetical protein
LIQSLLSVEQLKFKMASLIELPSDMIERIMMELDRLSLYRATLTCRRLNEIANSELVWRALIESQLSFRYLKKPNQSWRETFRLIYEQKPTIPHYQSGDIPGCPHYQRGAMIQAPCCQKFYPCHVCHDEKEQHKIDRFKIETMVCMNCRTVQPAARLCVQCSLEIASYHCGPCGIWTFQSIYHCDKCGICRVGKKEDNWHCDKCNVCFRMDMRNEHVCSIKDGYRTPCPICRSDELIFFSREPMTTLSCGHGVHIKCLFDVMEEAGWVCSLCQEEEPNPAL